MREGRCKLSKCHKTSPQSPDYYGRILLDGAMREVTLWLNDGQPQLQISGWERVREGVSDSPAPRLAGVSRELHEVLKQVERDYKR